MSASRELQSVLGRILTPAELSNLRQAIHVGARGLATGKYDDKVVARNAEKICKVIEGAHLVEARALEGSIRKPFVEYCKDLIVRSVLEEVALVGGLSAMFESGGGGERGKSSGSSAPEIF